MPNFNNFKNIFRKRRIFFYFLVLIIIALIFFLSFQGFNKNKTKEFVNSDLEREGEGLEEIETRVPRALDGFLVSDGEDYPFLITAIIDNQVEARPQFSLSLAPLVYDLPAEGGINRFLAFYPSNLENLSEIGPIRSARPYILDLAQEYNSLLLHCGGSPEALNKINKEKIKTLNEFYQGAYFRRISKYSAPHNILANFQKVKNYLEEENLKQSIFEKWKFSEGGEGFFKDNNFKAENKNFEVKLKRGLGGEEIFWIYDPEKNIYQKIIKGKIYQDNLGNEIFADNLVFQTVKTKILDKELRLELRLEGEGELLFCSQGHCSKGHWKKQGKNGRSFFYQNNDQEFVFKSGVTWLHLIDENSSLVY